VKKQLTGDSFNYTYTLIVRDGDGQRINGTTSCRDLEGAKQTAQDCLRLLLGSSFVDIYLYGVNLETSEPAEQVHRQAADSIG
jgi:hypothetical protein